MPWQWMGGLCCGAMMTKSTDFGPLFAPQSIAVIGASASGGGIANNFLRNLRAQGFPGRVYAVHPSAASAPICRG